MDPDSYPHHFGNPDPHPDLHPHGIKSGSASTKNQVPDPHQSDKLDPAPHQFADDKQKSMEYEPIWALEIKNLDPDPDPHQIKIRIRIRIRVKVESGSASIWIRIRIFI